MTGTVEYIPPIGSTTDQDVNLVGINGAAPVTGHGTAAGALRVELPTDGTGVVGLAAGSAIVGKVAIDQTTPGTTNGVQVNAALPAGTNGIGNVGGKTVTVSSTPTLGGTAYGTNYSVGGIQTLTGAFTATGSGVIQDIVVNVKKVETNGFFLVVFKSAPANAIADNAACNINVADFNTPLAIVPLNASSILGTQTTLSAYGLGLAVNTATTTLSVLLVCAAAMTNNLTAGDVAINVTVLQDL